MSQMPQMLHDNKVTQHRVITYLNVHGFKINAFVDQIRMTCPDGSVYHFDGIGKRYQILAGKNGVTLYNQPTLSCKYFIEFICAILALHKPSLIFPTMKILINFHEKEYEYKKKE